MIYSKALLALCAITQTTAFVVQAPKASTTQLTSSSVDDAFNGNELVWADTRPPPALANPAAALPADSRLAKNIWDAGTSEEQVLQGGSLRTFETHSDRVQVMLTTEGRPLNSKIELWHGPDYTPATLQIYLEDGCRTPFNAVIETPYSNSVAVYNTGHVEFPMSVAVEPDVDDGLADIKQRLYDTGNPITIQGGALRTFAMAPNVQSVQILLKTDGRHLVATIEILQGPNNKKQVIEVYSSDGRKRSFFAVFETPEAGCVIRVINKYTIEYPFEACVEPYLVSSE